MAGTTITRDAKETQRPIARLEHASKVYEVGDTVIRAPDDVSWDMHIGH